MTFVDDQLGTLLVGTWLQTVLFTIEVRQLVLYGQRFKKDMRALRYSIIALAVVDTVAVIISDCWVYRAVITDFGDIDKAAGPGWELCTVVAANLYAGFLCQCYLIWRYQRVSSNRWLSGLLALAVFCVSGLSIFVIYALTQPGSMSLLVSGKIAALIMFALQASIDIAIAAALAIFLIKAVKTDVVDRTKRLLVKLAFIAVESGSFTAILAIVTLVVTLTLFDTSNLPYLFVMLLGRTYALTLLFNLNLRKSAITRLGASSEQEGTRVITTPKHNGQVNVFQLAELRSVSNDGRKGPSQPMRNDELEVEYTKETYISDV